MKLREDENMKNKFTAMIFAVAGTTGLVGQAQSELSANVALTSDYVWRGVSQNDEDLALQGGFDYSHEAGFYIGLWGSNVSFSGASTELDIYAGWSTEFENGLGLDVGIIEYTYHGSSAANDNNFTEYYLGLSHSGFSALYSVGDEFDDHWEVGYEYAMETFALSAAYGDYDAYSYYRAGISGELGGFGLSLDYWDTDSDGDDIFGDLADGRLVFTVSKEF